MLSTESGEGAIRSPDNTRVRGRRASQPTFLIGSGRENFGYFLPVRDRRFQLPPRSVTIVRAARDTQADVLSRTLDLRAFADSALASVVR